MTTRILGEDGAAMIIERVMSKNDSILVKEKSPSFENLQAAVLSRPTLWVEVDGWTTSIPITGLKEAIVCWPAPAARF
jgi:hypothetical protein